MTEMITAATVLSDTRRYRLIRHMLKNGCIIVDDVRQMLELASYAAAERHVHALERARCVDIKLEPHPRRVKPVKTLVLTDTGRAAFEAQRQAFKELAAA
jgi:hypothetical protein